MSVDRFIRHVHHTYDAQSTYINWMARCVRSSLCCVEYNMIMWKSLQFRKFITKCEKLAEQDVIMKCAMTHMHNCILYITYSMRSHAYIYLCVLYEKLHDKGDTGWLLYFLYFDWIMDMSSPSGNKWYAQHPFGVCCCRCTVCASFHMDMDVSAVQNWQIYQHGIFIVRDAPWANIWRLSCC